MRKRQKGATSLEYIVLSAVLVLGLVLAISMFRDHLHSSIEPVPESANAKAPLTKSTPPQIGGFDKTFIILAIGAIVAALGWTFKKAVSSLQGRARLLIVDTLSSTPNLTRREVIDLVALTHWQLRFLRGVVLDALVDLVDKGGVRVRDGRYHLIDVDV